MSKVSRCGFMLSNPLITQHIRGVSLMEFTAVAHGRASLTFTSWPNFQEETRLDSWVWILYEPCHRLWYFILQYTSSAVYSKAVSWHVAIRLFLWRSVKVTSHTNQRLLFLTMTGYCTLLILSLNFSLEESMINTFFTGRRCRHPFTTSKITNSKVLAFVDQFQNNVINFDNWILLMNF